MMGRGDGLPVEGKGEVAAALAGTAAPLTRASYTLYRYRE